MLEIFIVEKNTNNFIVKLNKKRIITKNEIFTVWDKEEDAIRACILANQAFELAERCCNIDNYVPTKNI